MLKETSVVIIVKNGAAHIEELLNSVIDFNEVVIYDNGSTDDTESLARNFSNVSWYSGDFLGFGPTKAHAVSLAKNDWILSLDADEIVSEALKNSLLASRMENRQAGLILRENHFLGRAIRYSGWGKDPLIRFFNRTSAQFNDAKVHEQVVPQQGVSIVQLSGVIKHYAVDDLSQFLEKVNRYSSIRAESGLKARHPILIILKTFFAFFRTYILKLGLLDGWRGLVISVSNANGVFWKYIKAYAKKKVKNS